MPGPAFGVGVHKGESEPGKALLYVQHSACNALQQCIADNRIADTDRRQAFRPNTQL